MSAMSDLPTGPGAPTIRTRVTDLVGVDHPIVQTGMGWVSDARLTAATAAAGGLGILSAALLSFAELEAAIASIKAAGAIGLVRQAAIPASAHSARRSGLASAVRARIGARAASGTPKR